MMIANTRLQNVFQFCFPHRNIRSLPTSFVYPKSHFRVFPASYFSTSVPATSTSINTKQSINNNNTLPQRAPTAPIPKLEITPLGSEGLLAKHVIPQESPKIKKKLSAEEIQEMKLLRVFDPDTYTARKLGKIYGVSSGVVSIHAPAPPQRRQLVKHLESTNSQEFIQNQKRKENREKIHNWLSKHRQILEENRTEKRKIAIVNTAKAVIQREMKQINTVERKKRLLKRPRVIPKSHAIRIAEWDVDPETNRRIPWKNVIR